VISCLRKAGVGVDEVHLAVWDDDRNGWSAGPAQAAKLAAAEARLLLRRPRDFDAFIVGYPGHFDLPAARRAARGRPIVFNPLVSLADTLVADRGRFPAGSLAARTLDDVPVCFVGAEERLFKPGWQRADEFVALFVGKLIPLQGVETILAAARLAPDIRFRIVGSGQLDGLLGDPPPNVEHVPWIEYEQLPDEIRQAGCSLGIFGTTGKARRVIPNKAFQAIACGAPLVTADTPAARELLSDEASALLVPAGDAEALAGAISRLAADPELASRIAAGGRAAYEGKASEAVLGDRWREIIERLL
jgi:glycosyltransferase involved in cell wall biosynthesis